MQKAERRPAPRGAPCARLLDWRFLLPRGDSPVPRHVVLLGGAEELGDLAGRLGVAERVSRSLPGDGSADAIVVLPDARISLPEAMASLTPDGVLCWFVDRRSADQVWLTPSRARHRLEVAGLHEVACYYARGGGPASMYLPLSVDDAIRWYFDSLYGAGTWPRRLLRTALQLLTGWRGGRLSPLVPSYVVIARPDGRADGLPALISTCTRGGIGDPRRLPLFLMGGEGEWSRVVALRFEPGTPEPRQVMKVPRLPTFNLETAREEATLVDLRSGRDPALRSSIPEPTGDFDWNGLHVTCQGFLRGRPLVRSAQGRRARRTALRELELATNWLTDFHAGSRQPPLLPYALIARLVDEPLNEYSSHFGVKPAEKRLFERFRAEVLARADDPLPLVIAHRDFTPGNVLRMECDRVGVIDWEVARVGPPVADLLYFAMHWYWSVRGIVDESERRRALRLLFFGSAAPDPLGTASRAAAHRYLTALQIDPAWVPSILIHMMIEQALDRADRLRASGRSQTDPRADNRYVAYVEYLSDHVEDLFGPEQLSVGRSEAIAK